jgi:arabinogalactan oligomer / maltooligosaccharide transport system substrate-binding protein
MKWITMNKKTCLLSCIVLAAVMLSTACGAGPTATSTASSADTFREVLTIWHSYPVGSLEEKSLNQILDAYNASNQYVTVKASFIPSDQIQKNWDAQVAAGNGPDMFMGSSDNLGKESRTGLIAPIDGLVSGKLDGYSKMSIDGLTLDGKLYGIPAVSNVVSLYYNKTKIPAPPTTTQELMDLVKAGKKIVLYEDVYHSFGFFGAFGGALTDNNGKCIADQGGVADAMQYLIELKTAGKANNWDVFQTDGSKADSLFRQGQADMIINDTSVYRDYKSGLGSKLGVAPMPSNTSPATPISAPYGWFINPKSKMPQAAVDLALFLTNADVEKMFADITGAPPVRSDVNITDQNIKTLVDAFGAGYARPQAAWYDNFWGPFNDMVVQVIEGKSTPANGVKTACDAMNKANNK